MLGAAVIALGTVGTAGAALALVLRGTPAPAGAVAVGAGGDAKAPASDTGYPACPDAVSEWVEDVRMGPRETTTATLADVDGDGNLDALFTNQYDETVSIWWGRKGAMPEAERLDVKIGRSYASVAVGDVDGDGLNDLVAALQDDAAFGIVRGLGQRRFSAPTREFQSPPPQEVVLVDEDGDGRLDIVFQENARLDVRRHRTTGWAPHVALSMEAAREIVLSGVARFSGTPKLLVTVDGALALRPVRGAYTPVTGRLTRWLAAPPPSSESTEGAYARTAGNDIVRVGADGAPCRLGAGPPIWPIVAVGDLDGDSVLDGLAFDSCRKCTSNHVFLRGVGAPMSENERGTSP